MKIKRVLAMLLTVCLILGCLPMGVLAASFDDTEGHWGEAAIDRWSGYGILTGDGDGNFRPDDHITRAEAATALSKTLGLVNKAENTFTDLGDDWYTDYILQCVAYGAMSGYADGTVVPNRNITREEAALLMAGALGIDEVAGDTTFDDDDKISDWAKGAVKALQELGIVQGDNNQFSPDSYIDRAALVTILDNAIAGYITEGGVYTEDYDGIVVVKVEAGEEVIFDGATIGGNLIVAESVTGESAVKLVEDKTVVEGDIIAGEDVVEWIDEDEVPPSDNGGGTDPGPGTNPTPAPSLQNVDAEPDFQTVPLVVEQYNNGPDEAYIYIYPAIEQAKGNSIELSFGSAAVTSAAAQTTANSTGFLTVNYTSGGNTVDVGFVATAAASNFDTWPGHDGTDNDLFDVKVETDDGFTYYICFFASNQWDIQVDGYGKVEIVEATSGVGNGTAYPVDATLTGSEEGSCVTEPDSVLFTFTPASGYVLTDFKIDGTSFSPSGNTYIYTASAAQSALYTVEVKFEEAVADVDGTLYADFDAAVAALTTNSVMTLLTNVEYTANSGVLTLDKNVTIDGGGFILEANGIEIGATTTATTVTVQDLTLDGGSFVVKAPTTGTTKLVLDDKIEVVDADQAIFLENDGLVAKTEVEFSSDAKLTFNEDAGKPTILIEKFYFGFFPELFITNNSAHFTLTGTPKDLGYYAYMDDTQVPAVAVRPVGDAGDKTSTPTEYTQEYDYAAAYKKAGIEVEIDGTNVEITTDFNVLNQISDAQGMKHIFPNSDVSHTAGPVVGLIFATPADAMYVEYITDGSNPASTINTLTSDPLYTNSTVGGSVNTASYGGNYMEYFRVSELNGTLGDYEPRLSSPVEVTVAFYDDDGDLIDYTDVEVKFVAIQDTTSGSDVASIGTTDYNTLQAALAAATAGQTITLNNDITLTTPAIVDKNVTIAGNGKKIDVNGLEYGIIVEADQALTLTGNVDITGASVAGVYLCEGTTSTRLNISGIVNVTGNDGTGVLLGCTYTNVSVQAGGSLTRTDEAYGKSLMVIEDINPWSPYTYFTNLGTSGGYNTVVTADGGVEIYTNTVDVPAMAMRPAYGTEDYPGDYQAIGVSVADTGSREITITVDGSLYQSNINAYSHLQNGGYTYVGIVFATPSNASTAELTLTGQTPIPGIVLQDPSQTTDYSAYGGSLIQYFSVGDSSGVIESTYEFDVKFFDATSGTISTISYKIIVEEV